MSDDLIMMLENVRCSFPHVTSEQKNKKGKKVGYSCKLLLDPKNPAHVKQLNSVKDLMVKAVKASVLKKMPPADKRCLRNGNDTERAENQGMYLISTNAKAKDKPFVFDKKGREITSKKDTTIYSGCYVNCQISLWVQNNKHGKRVNAQIRGIRFVADGESLDGSYVARDDVAKAMGATEEPVADAPPGDEFDDDIPF